MTLFLKKMKKTSKDLQLIEAKEAFEDLKQAYSSDSWNDSVKDSYGILLDQQSTVLERLSDYTEAMNDLVQDKDLQDIEALIELAKSLCDKAGDIQ